MMFRNNGVTGHRGNCEAAPETKLALDVDFLKPDVRESAAAELRKLNMGVFRVYTDRPALALRINGESK